MAILSSEIGIKILNALNVPKNLQVHNIELHLNVHAAATLLLECYVDDMHAKDIVDTLKEYEVVDPTVFENDSSGFYQYELKKKEKVN